jgi:hypothetical protein
MWSNFTHIRALPVMGLGAIGGILLGVGAAIDSLAWLAIGGGVLLAFGMMGYVIVNHRTAEHELSERLDRLERS